MWHEYASIGIFLDDPSHDRFHQVVREKVGDDEIEIFQSAFSATERNSGQLMTLTGPVQVLTIDRLNPANPPDGTGSFDTEIISMSLQGTSPSGGPIIVRQDPSRPSLGHTEITDIGGGQFHIDSFFDVFTEISVDGGTSWIPSTNGTHMTLTPEPGSLVLLGMGALGFLAFFRRRKRAA